MGSVWREIGESGSVWGESGECLGKHLKVTTAISVNLTRNPNAGTSVSNSTRKLMDTEKSLLQLQYRYILFRMTHASLNLSVRVTSKYIIN